MGRKLKRGDKVRLSEHGLKVKARRVWIRERDWQKAVRRNSKDIYTVAFITDDGQLVGIGHRLPGLFKSETGPITLCILDRDWVKRAD